MAETVILVPGVGFGGIEFVVLTRRLRKEGYRVRIFWQSPWRRKLTVTAEALSRMLTADSAETLHFVAHSLGGRVVLQMLNDFPQQKVKRIVMLGVPLIGCLAARRVMRFPGGRWFLGNALASICTQSVEALPAECEIGSIAGRLNFLFGLLLCPRKPNDTLICVEETQHPDLAAHCVLPVTHSSILLSHKVSEQICSFLRTGAFSVANANRV